jgi:hypothetical protein
MLARRFAVLFAVLSLAIVTSASACRKTTTLPPADIKCTSDDQCTISCDSRGGCCHAPCCSSVVHKDIAADAVAFNRENCTKDDFAKCPNVGGCVEEPFIVTPRCRAGACVGERVPRKETVVPDAAVAPEATPDASPPDTSPLDASCAKDDDCVPAPSCCPVPCTSRVINKKELPKVHARNAATCPKTPQCISAGGCRTHAYLCVKKSCQLVFSDSPDYRERRP